MADLTVCKENLIGLTGRDCDCYDATGKSYNITESTSGVYVDNYIDLSAAAYERCGDESLDLFDRMNAALIKGQKFVSQEISKRLVIRGYDRVPTWNDYIGGNRFRNVLTISETYAGQFFRFKRKKGAKVRILGVESVFNSTGTYTLTFVDTNSGVSQNQTVHTTAGSWRETLFSTPIEYDLWDGSTYSENPNFGFVAYHSQSGAYDNKAICSVCSGRRPEWSQYFEQHTVRSNSATVDPLVSNLSGDYANGFRLKIEIVCDIDDALCQITGADEATLALAWGKAAARELLIELASTGTVNKWTVYKGDAIQAKLQQYNAELNDELEHLTTLAERSECYQCRPQIRRGIIR